MTKYNEGMEAKVVEYIATHRQLGQELPTTAGLALFLGVCRKTLVNWQTSEETLNFSALYDQMMCTQEVKLINGGLSNEYNAHITKLLLSRHGYTTVTDVNHGGQPGNQLPKQTMVFMPVSSDDDDDAD